MRLTQLNQDRITYCYSDDLADSCQREETILNNLGQLEDIEEELGIDLITFWKLLTRGCYYKVDGEILYTFGDVNIAGRVINTCYTKLTFKDYGKTWSLTKEELL